MQTFALKLWLLCMIVFILLSVSLSSVRSTTATAMATVTHKDVTLGVVSAAGSHLCFGLRFYKSAF